jgi:HK97 gp10 family phage protein
MVQGLSQLNRRWRAIPRAVRENTKREMEQIAQNIVDDMYGMAPHLTGDLAGSIAWTWGDAPKGSMTIGTVGGKEYGALRITIYAADGDQFYGKFQEFGTSKMAANPFFFPVWRVRRRSAKNRITRAMRKGLKSA